MSSLTKLLSAAALFVISNNSVAQSSAEIKDTTYAISSRPAEGFNSIRLQGPFNVYITQGSAESLRLDAPNEILSSIVTEVNSSVLKVHNKHDYWFHAATNWYGEKSWWQTHKRVSVYITVKNLRGISVSGSGTVYFNNGISADYLRLRVVGSGKMEGKVDAKTLRGRMSGSGHIKLAGNAGSSTVRISGSGNFSARDMVTLTSAVHVSGSGHAEVNATDELSAQVRGSAHVGYTGAPKTVSSSKSGSGVVSRL